MPSLPTTPCVSVVIPLFNAGRFVEEAVASALAQPETLEVIVVDDGSTDDGLARCLALAGNHPQRLLVLRHADEGNHGAGASRNLGIAQARGELIAFLDADDYFLPNRFGRSVPQLVANADLDGVYEAVQVMFDGPDAQRDWDPLARTLITLPENVAPPHLLRLLVQGRQGNFHTGGIMLRRRAFERAGVFDSDLSLGQDTALWWRLAACCRLVGGQLDRPVAIYRRHGRNRSGPHHPEFRRTRLTVAKRTWDWARNHDCPREQLRVLAAAYGRALATWDAGTEAECLRVMVTHLRSDPGIALGLPFWGGLVRRVARTLWHRLRDGSPTAGMQRLPALSDPRSPAGAPLPGLAVLTFVALSLATAIVREPYHDEGVTSEQVAGPLAFEGCDAGCSVTKLRSTPYSSPHDVVNALTERGLHPPAYYLLLFGWTRLAGLGLLALRLPGIVMGAITVIGFAALAGRLVDRSVGRSAAWLAAVSPWLVQISAYARPYSMAVALTVVSSWLLLSTSERRWAILLGWVGLSALGTYTIYHYAFVVAIQAALWLWRGPGAARARLATTAAGLMVLLLLYSPWLPIAWHHVQNARGPFHFTGRGRLTPLAWGPAAIELLSRFLLGALTPRYAPPVTLLLTSAMILVLVRRRRELRPGVRLTLYYLAGIVALMFTVDELSDAHTLFIGKTAFGLYPPILILLAATLSYLGALGRRVMAILLVAATVLQIAREAWTATDMQRVAASVRAQGAPEGGELVVMNHSKRGFSYPVLMELERAGLSNVRVTVADESQVAERVRRVLEAGETSHLTLVEFFEPPGPGDNLWKRETLQGITRVNGPSITVFRGVVPHSPRL